MTDAARATEATTANRSAASHATRSEERGCHPDRESALVAVDGRAFMAETTIESPAGVRTAGIAALMLDCNITRDMQ